AVPKLSRARLVTVTEASNAGSSDAKSVPSASHSRVLTEVRSRSAVGTVVHLPGGGQGRRTVAASGPRFAWIGPFTASQLLGEKGPQGCGSAAQVLRRMKALL